MEYNSDLDTTGLHLNFHCCVCEQSHLFRFLYRHARATGYKSGNDFLNWMRVILQENQVDTVESLKNKITNETRFKPLYKPPALDRKGSEDSGYGHTGPGSENYL
jgi:hypothetical protein